MFGIAVNSTESGFFGCICNPIALTGPEKETIVTKYYVEMMAQVQKYKRQNGFTGGKIWHYVHPDPEWATILNMPVREHIKKPISKVILEDSIQNLATTYKQRGIEMIWMPQFGYGEPDAPDWETWTKPMLAHYFVDSELHVFVQEHRP